MEFGKQLEVVDARVVARPGTHLTPLAPHAIEKWSRFNYRFTPQRSHSAGLLPAVLCRPRRVLADAALEELDAVRLEGEGVRADVVEEPAVVRDDERAAREVLQRLF